MAVAKLLARTPILEVSPEKDLIIPASILAALGIEPGQKFVVLAFQDSIRLIPLVTHEEARGSMPGLDKLVLAGTVLKYIDPTEPVAEDDWEALG